MFNMINYFQIVVNDNFKKNKTPLYIDTGAFGRDYY